jgi:hypothetical protein
MYASAEGNSGDTRPLHGEPWTRLERKTDEMSSVAPTSDGRQKNNTPYGHEYPPHQMGPVHRGVVGIQ